MKLRSEYKDLFEKRHGIKLGFMGFFVKACLHGAARRSPPSTPRSTAARSSTRTTTTSAWPSAPSAAWSCRWCARPTACRWPRSRPSITDFGKRARDGKLGIDEMQGGTFTISNGGVYGSLLSTPILNAPQSGILGMHRIEERPVARNGQVVVAPDDVPGAHLRSPHRRRPRGRDLPRARQGMPGGPAALPAGSCEDGRPDLTT